MAGNTALLVAQLNAAALALAPFTVVRSHFAFLLKSDQNAAEEIQSCAAGLAIVSAQAVDIGVTAIPTPFTDLGSSLWFAHKTMFANATNAANITVPAAYFELDSKAMRKVEVGQDLVFVMENGSSAGLIMQSAGRILIKTN